jgi:hypothetical protein
VAAASFWGFPLVIGDSERDMPGIKPWAPRLVDRRSDHWATRTKSCSSRKLEKWQQHPFSLVIADHERDMPGVETWAPRLVHQRSDQWATRSEAFSNFSTVPLAQV